MTENKRFIIDIGEPQHENAFFEYDEHFDDYEFVCWEDDFDSILNKFNELGNENEQLKSVNMEYEDALGRLEEENDELKKENQKLKTQLLHGDGVCDICKHEYLVKTGNYYVPKCKKGHEECSQIDLAYCGDFEVKECKG